MAFTKHHMEWYRQVLLVRQYLFYQFWLSAIEQTYPNKRCTNFTPLLITSHTGLKIFVRVVLRNFAAPYNLHFFHFLPSTVVRELQVSCTRDSISKFFIAASQTAPLIELLYNWNAGCNQSEYPSAMMIIDTTIHRDVIVQDPSLHVSGLQQRFIP